ncbi:MAG: phage terminase large subunit [Clostridia bacterium]|nr:phage terminase large subunit [Clostridia bacterium]
MGPNRLTIPPPSEKQRAFFDARARYVAFGGARGGGKSWAVRVKALMLALEYPGIKIMVVRKTYPELRANHIRPMLALLPPGAVYSDREKEIRFDSGSLIMFRYCDTDADADRYQGTECDVLFIDEATQMSEEQFSRLKCCVRGANGFPKRTYLTCNPGGRGHAWVKRLFVDREFRADEDPGDYVFIRSLLADNAALLRDDPGYLKQLESLPQRLRRAWLDGDWSSLEGQFFSEFRDDPAHYGDGLFSHVVTPFDVPASWQVWRSFDFGYSRPFSCDWWTLAPDGCYYLIAQYYGASEPNVGLRLPPDRLFGSIRERENTDPVLRWRRIDGVADPSIWDRSRGEAIVECADRHGIHFAPGDNRRVPGWMKCRNLLAFDDGGRCRIRFFSCCADAIRTLQTLEFSKTNPEDLDSSGEDHFADSMRYFVMSRL